MKIWQLIKIGGGALILICLLLSFIKRDRGPVLEGRPLESWVQDLLITADPIKHTSAKKAVSQLGTNAIPWLQKTLLYKDPIWKRPFIGISESVSFIEPKTIYRWANTYELAKIRAGGAAGLAELGQLASPAIPALVESLGDPEHLVYNNALLALNKMGKLPFSEITNRLFSVQGEHQTRMLHVLRNMQEEAVSSAPELLKIIESQSGSNEANAAIAALSTMGIKAAPAAVQLAISDRYELRLAGFNVLSRLLPVEHELWTELKSGIQLGHEKEKEVFLALQNVWGNSNEAYTSLSDAIFHGTPSSSRAAILLMSVAAKPGNASERKLNKLRNKTLKSAPKKIKETQKKIDGSNGASLKQE